MKRTKAKFRVGQVVMTKWKWPVKITNKMWRQEDVSTSEFMGWWYVRDREPTDIFFERELRSLTKREKG